MRIIGIRAAEPLALSKDTRVGDAGIARNAGAELLQICSAVIRYASPKIDDRHESDQKQVE